MAAPPLRSGAQAPDYPALIEDLSGALPADRLITDPLRRLAWGTDASFYRLVPQVVAQVASEAEARAVLAACRRHRAPVTFRAAGTSLSGQAVSDSVLMVLGDGWRDIAVEAGGAVIRLQPGVTGAEANRRLAPHGRKIGPDPASIDAAKIGGIAANNASGMCCGTAENSYRTLKSMRLILADGTLVDTGDPASVAEFRASHAPLLDRLDQMARATRANPVLSRRIRSKYVIKNTTGYSLNALIDFYDPVDILQHLMIGSEGTLGFIAEITYRTVADHADRASALILFPDLDQACHAVQNLAGQPVSAVELMDRAALRSVESMPGMPVEILDLPEEAAALLVEARADSPAALTEALARVEAALSGTRPLLPVAFTADPAAQARLWKVRKGLLPAAGAVRPPGTTVIIEDVAVRMADLAAATRDIRTLLLDHGYRETILFGHALAGNLHMVFTPDLGTAAEIERYDALMRELAQLVVERYDGSLKAEHGTGRNMAPFVALEWGREAHALMRDIKALCDPRGLLNPGVILNDDPRAHLSHLKPLPAADSRVDTCMECGFCERMCPSHGLTLSPRQRIVGWREIARTEASGDRDRNRDLRALWTYQGLDTCAACGLCATACPVGIDTGTLTRHLRGRAHSPLDQLAARAVGTFFGAGVSAARLGLAMAGRLGRSIGPLDSDTLPRPAKRPRPPAGPANGQVRAVYFPTCSTRVLGPSAQDSDPMTTPDHMLALFAKAGLSPILPRTLDGLCCGLAFDSKGFADEADARMAATETALREASDNGRHPIVMDATSCSQRARAWLAGRLPILDSIEFLHDLVLPRLDIVRATDPILLHINCSARKMGLEGKLLALAHACAETVIVPDDVGCCGFAGDRGFSTPALNAHALRHLAAAVPAECEAGYSTNRTCEIGLALHGGRPYRSVAALLDRVSRPGRRTDEPENAGPPPRAPNPSPRRAEADD